MFFIFACTQLASTKPDSKPDIVQEAFATKEEKKSSEDIVIPLTSIEYCDGGTYATRSREDFVDVPQHPESKRIVHYYDFSIGDTIMMTGVEKKGETWEVSSDFDGNGSISEQERFSMAKASTKDDKNLYEVDFRVPYPTKEYPDYQLEVFLTIEEKDKKLILTDCVRSGRRGVAPIDGGIVFQVWAKGGDFSLPQTEIIIDGDGDGKADVLNFLNKYSQKERVIQLKGKNFQIDLDMSGTTLTLRPTEKTPTGLHLLSSAPEFDAMGTDGEMHSLQKYRGKLLLIDFWATWCAPCIALHPDVEALAKKYQLNVLGVSADDTLDDVKRWLKKNPTPWPSIAQGPAGPVNLAYGINAWPTHALVDEEGRLLAMGLFESIQEVLENIYKENPQESAQ